MAIESKSHLSESKHCDLLTLPFPITQMIISDGGALVSYSRSRAYLKRLRWPLWKGKEIPTWITC